MIQAKLWAIFFGRDNFYHGYTDVGGTLKQYDLPGGKSHFSTSLFGINNNGDLAGAAGGGTLAQPTRDSW
jgi:hypothetical protein